MDFIYDLLIGRRYKFMKHEHHPTGVAVSYDDYTEKITIKWEDPKLFPPTGEYPFEYFIDGTFEEIDSENYCEHEWKHYIGFREEYDYCVYCPAKKPSSK